MANLQQLFLASVRAAWQRRFPFLEPVEISEIPKRDKGGNYRCSTFFAQRQRIYFFAYQFSRIRPGEFTLNITISDSPDRSVLAPCWAADVAAQKIGSYRIGSFIGKNDYWWALRDVDSEMRNVMQSLSPAPAEAPPALATPNRWRPTSFDQPLPRIFDEAIDDISHQLKRHVFPKIDFPENADA